MKDSNERHYFSTIDKGELETLLIKSENEDLPVKLWLEGESESTVEEYDVIKADVDRKTLFLNSKGFLSKISGSKLLDKKVFIKLGEEKFQYFSYTTLQYDDSTKDYFIKLTSDVYRTQQRENYRLMASSTTVIEIRITTDQVFKGLDISAGGTSFLIDADQQEDYQKGTIFKNCTLNFNKKDFSIPTLKIVGLWEQKDSLGQATDQIKLGVAFEDLKDSTEEALFKHISEEARVEQIRKRLKNTKE